MTLEWMSRDGKLVILTRGVRGFGYGFLSVVLAIYLSKIGFSNLMIFAALSATLLGSAAFTVFASLYADRLGRKRLLIVLSIMMAISGTTFALTTNVIALFLAAIIGTLSPTGAEIGSFLPMEQTILPQTTTEEKRTSAFAAYNIVGYLALTFGGLFGGFVGILKGLHFAELDAYRTMFLIYAALALTVALLYTALSSGAEISTGPGRARRQKMSPASKKIVARLSGLFAIDAFAGGFVLQAFILYWFYSTYGVAESVVAEIAFVANLLTTLSMYAAVWMSKRFGLLNTMVFTHIPSNIFLILIPVANTFLLSVAFFFARQAISQMDVPTRHSYTMAIVAPEERIAAAGTTAIARNVSQATSPLVAGVIQPIISLSGPFLIGGALKLVYDVGVYFNFRHVKPPEEMKRT